MGAVAAIERRCFSDPWSARSLADTLARPEVVFLALDLDGRLRGYAIGALAGGEAEILNLAVDPACRRLGHGTSLLQALLAALAERRAERVYLEVRCSNLAAIGLYEARGFRRIGSRPGYYSHPREDAVTMGLDLAPAAARKG